MSYYYDEHDEDDLPEITIPAKHYTRDLSDDDDDDDEQAKNSLQKWRNLHEASIHSLQSDDDDDEPKTTNGQLSYESTSIHCSPGERPESPNPANKSKWEIRLPELLNSTVGPDRQKREVVRRHTTNIVFQHASETNGESNETVSNPLVKQLKQKFDQMTVESAPKMQRVGSLNTKTTPRPVHPVRPTPEIVRKKPPTSLPRNKSGPPVSYPKHFYPPPSTTSVVRQLIDSGATLVYDSKTPKTSVKIKPVFSNSRSIEETREELISTNVPLTGRQMKNKDNRGRTSDDAQTNHHYQPRRRSSSSVKN